MRRRLSLAITTLLITIVLASLAPGSAAITAQAAKTIAVIDTAFQPATLSIPAGATITWTLQGSAQHSITSDDGLWDSGQLSSQPFAHIFATPGTYAYHCAIHPQAMRGTITVVPPSYLPLILKPGATADRAATATAEALATAEPSPSATATVQPSATATVTAPPVSGFRGNVRVRPRWAVVETQPTEYEIILDVGGSMSWNFAGQAGDTSSPIQCTPASSRCGDVVWNPVEERRIYSVKQALKGLIDHIGPNDIMRITAFTGALGSNFDNQRAIDLLTTTLPSGGWSNDKVVLKSAIDAAGAVNNDPYHTLGTAPSATAFAAAAQVLATAPITAPSGLAYQRAVIFLTDSVANVFLDGQLNTAMDICSSNPAALGTASCQIGTTTAGRLRPITAMIDRADALKQAAVVYVVALADVETTGLPQVASVPSYPFFATSTSGSDLDAILNDITTDVANGDCMPGGGNQWVDHIDAQNAPLFPPPNTLPPDVFGYVYLYDENGAPLPAGQNMLPIVHDPLSGTLTFELPQSQGLAPGVYQLRAYAGYKGADGVSRVYEGLFNPNTFMIDTTLVFVLDPASALGPVIPLEPIYLDLQGQVCP